MSVEKTDRISSSEWTLLIIFFIFGLSLVAIAKWNVSRVAGGLQGISLDAKECLVTVSGAVKNPGTYPVLEGTPLASVLRKAGMRLDSDLRAIDLQSTIQKSLNIQIGSLEEIQVQIDGAVMKPVELRMQVGSRICDLRSKISCSEEADLRFFRRRKILRDGDKIWIPKKTVEQN